MFYALNRTVLLQGPLCPLTNPLTVTATVFLGKCIPAHSVNSLYFILRDPGVALPSPFTKRKPRLQVNLPACDLTGARRHSQYLKHMTCSHTTLPPMTCEECNKGARI